MKTNAEALGAITAMIVGFVLLMAVVVGSAGLVGLWVRIFIEAAGL